MGKLIDLVGQHFGMWEVLERGTTKKTNSGTVVYWKCRCDCGIEKEVRGADLRNGKSTTCGCSRGEGQSNLEGMRFGRLIAIEVNGKDKYKNFLWRCKCDCGNETLVNSTQLRQGKTQSCGCLQRERTSQSCKKDLTGKRFGKWLVLQETAGHMPGTHYYWDCLCDCGTTASVDGGNLISGNSQSCGCEYSRGERIIASLLTEYNIPFSKEKTFPDLFSENGFPLRYDFWINNNYLIEFDGIQHFQTQNSGWNNEKSLIQNQQRDKIKNQYCFDNNLPLIRIPYTHLSKLCLEDLLLETSQFIVKKDQN